MPQFKGGCSDSNQTCMKQCLVAPASHGGIHDCNEDSIPDEGRKTEEQREQENKVKKGREERTIPKWKRVEQTQAE